MTTLRKLLDVVTFILGAVCLLVGVFSFGYGTHDFGEHWGYFYGTKSLILIGVGGALLILGWLRRSWGKGRN